MTHAQQERVVDELLKSRKYRHLCPDTLNRIAGWSLARHGQPKEAVKTAKRKLHQVYAAYLDKIDWARFERMLDQLPEAAADEALKGACLPILESHASAAERIPILAEVFSALFRETGTPRVIVDLACGLNPFALPWMSVPPATEYYAYDIDDRLTSAINTLLDRLGRPGAAYCHDILVDTPSRHADVVLLLKTLPCLEQQDKGISATLLAALLPLARFVVVSFPAQSLGGRSKGMPEHYSAFIEPLVQHLHCNLHRLDFPTEVFYLLNEG